MVQFIKRGQEQTGEKPEPVQSKTQYTLFGNGQDERYATPAEKQAAAAAKFAKTGEGKRLATEERRPRASDNWDRRDLRDDTKYKPRGECHHTHKPYPVAEGVTIIGGSGLHPFNKTCDLYLALDNAGPQSQPWDGTASYVFHIPNYGVPKDPAAFKTMILWLVEQIKAGRKLHVGCMAGHGRTGMVLAALRRHLTGDPDAIMHVRGNYCDQAVETDEQIAWLVKHWDMNPAPPRKHRHGGGTPRGSVMKVGKFDADAAFGDKVDRFETEPLMSLDAPREPRHTSWVANSPWQTEPQADPPTVEGDAPWYDEGEGLAED